MFELRRDIVFYQLKDAILYWLIIPATVIISGLYLDFFFQASPLFNSKNLMWMGWVLLACGLLFISLSTRDLRLHGHGTPNKLRPARLLVTRGVYSICRHPMFFGYDLIALAIAFFFNSRCILFCSFPLFICLQLIFLQREEQLLAKKFRSDFPVYKKSVPFLIPFTSWEI